jgi:ABC-type multidrug transport system, ATPase and permease components
MMKISEIRAKTKEAAKNVAQAFKLSFIVSPRLFIAKCILLIISSLTPLLTMWLWKEIINMIVLKSESAERFIAAVITYFAITVVVKVYETVDDHLSLRYGDEIEIYRGSFFINKISRVDLAYFDSAKLADRLSTAMDGFYSLEELTWSIFTLTSDFINCVISFAVILSANPLIGVVIFALTLPNFIFGRRMNKKSLSLQKEMARDSRKEGYFITTLRNHSTRLEMILNGMGQYFITQYANFFDKNRKKRLKFDNKKAVMSSLLELLTVIGDVFVLLLSAYRITSGGAGIGDLQFNLNMASYFRGKNDSFLGNVVRFMKYNDLINELNSFVEMKSVNENSGELTPSPCPKIEFRNVTFRYPDTDTEVLKDCSFTIKPREKIGLIGLNGAGKTTIIKLLLRFYDPQEGTIFFDGTDIKEYDVYALRRIFGVLFQDVIRYQLKVREVIALSDYDECLNDEKLNKACADSGFDSVINEWEDGYDSYLGRYLSEKGRDLSGGQWQLLSLARAYFRECEFMILDEPSASLDAITEDAIFRQMYELSREKGSIVISHQLSNVTLADKILLLEDGRITEEGTHGELLAKNGKYAQLFALQASKYL